MAKQLNATGYGLEIDTVTDVDTVDRPTTDTNYKLVSCATEVGMDYTIDEIDTSNKCDDGAASSQPGNSSWSFNWNGQATDLTLAEEAIKANFQQLLELANNKTVFFARIVNPDDDNYVREGKVYITAFNETLGNQALFAVTATFKGTGRLFVTPLPVTP